MTLEVKPPLEEVYLEHFGVKGMKWGVRKERTPAEKRALAKKVAIGTGVLLVTVGAAAVAYHLHKNKKASIKDVASTISKGKSAVDSILHEQVDVIHASRGKHKGFRFLKTGGLPDPLQTYTDAFKGAVDSKDYFQKLDNGTVAARFLDLSGRRDHATRMIPHEVIIPKSMAGDIHSIDDVKSKIWPLLKDTYDTFYEGSTNRGF